MSTEMTWETLSISSAETKHLGELLGRLISGGDSLELVADLGGGKTTFVKGLTAGMGSKDTVSSPTFTLNNVYRAKKLEIHHYDFYRLDSPGVLKDQLEESLDNPSVVTVVEWGQIVEDVLPADKLTIRFSPTAGNADERKISLGYPPSKINVIKELETNWTGLRS